MIAVETILFVAACLMLVSIFFSNISSRFGVPVLLLFLVVGMVFGSDGIGLEFSNFYIAQGISTFALSVILFSGGLDTKINDIRPIIREGVILATLGVVLTALITGFFIYYVANTLLPQLDISLLESFLLASVMASTDSASVFAILRNKGLSLKNNLRPLLELESGSNDPIAYLLTVTLIQMIMSSSINGFEAVGSFVLQLVVGAIAGYGLGKLCVIIINRINLSNTSLYPVLLLAMCIFVFSFTYFIKGNGYLAVYMAGLMVGNSKFFTKRTTVKFFDGFAWLFQIVMFLTLGLLVSPRALLSVMVPAIVIGLFLTFFARPISVQLCLLPFNRSMGEKNYIAWVGLRGAVPIVFAILPLAAGVPHAQEIFNIVFFITIISLLFQGSSLGLLAKFLKLTGTPLDENKLKYFDMEFDEEIKSAMTEITLTESIMEHGKTLMQMPLPDGTLAVMVKRGQSYFIPKGNTELMAGDKLLIITDNEDALKATYKAMGVSKFQMRKN